MSFNMNKLVDDHSYVITGTVIDENESNYSSTRVSTDKNYHVQSRVDHHQDQVIWYKTDDGKEDSVRLYTCRPNQLLLPLPPYKALLNCCLLRLNYQLL